MKLIRNISLLLAGGILLLHSVLPHEHHSELKAEEHISQHESASNLWDFLKLAFHMDQGEGHLENFNSSNIMSPIFMAILVGEIHFDFEPIIESATAPTFLIFQDNLPFRCPDAQIRFRGPPSQG